MATRSALVVPEELSAHRRVRLARHASGLTPKAIADALGISKRSYERSEAGDRRFTRAELLVVAQLTAQDPSLFGVTSDAAEEGAMLSDLQPRVNGEDETE